MKRTHNPILPRYAYLPLAVVCVVNFLAYTVTKWITAGWDRYDMALGIDALVPFWPVFISIYVLAFAQWCVGYVCVARDSRQLFEHVAAADVVAKLICLVCFLAVPTVLYRPEITGTSLWENLTRFIYWTDSPDNLFPSVHCLESWICMRGALLSKKVPKWYQIVMVVFTLLVCASTVLVKQHVVVDIFGGIAAAEIGLFAAKKFRLGRVFARRRVRLPKN